MIAFVRGQVAAVTLTSAVLEVGGVGLELMCTPGTLATLRIGPSRHAAHEHGGARGLADPVRLRRRRREAIFELVQTASGVGPKLAQAMLAVLAPDDLRRAVAGEDVKTLTRVPGIGQKGAQRIILELKDRIGAPTGVRRAGQAAPRPARPGATRCTRGCVGLGWSAKEAEQAVEAVAPEAGDQPRRRCPAARRPAHPEQGLTP